MKDGEVSAVAAGDELRVAVVRTVNGKEFSGCVMLRRVGRSESNDLMISAGYTDGNDGTKAKYGELLCRAAIVGTDCVDEAGRPVKFELVAEPGVRRKIACVAAYDALTSEEVSEVIAKATGKLTEKQTGN